jgi:hypothetical protein
VEARPLNKEKNSCREDRLSRPQTQEQQSLRPVTQDWVDANLFQPHAVTPRMEPEHKQIRIWSHQF